MKSAPQSQLASQPFAVREAVKAESQLEVDLNQRIAPSDSNDSAFPVTVIHYLSFA